MHRLTHASADTPLHDKATTRRIEARTLASVPPGTLVQRAGLAVARLATAITPHARRRLVVAGPGNNGADALEAAIALHGAGHAVQVVLAAPPGSADAATSLARARQAGVPIGTDWPADEDAFDLAIDGLFGIGLSRPPQDAMASTIDRLNAGGWPVLAIDIPSGLNADTGQPVGAGAVRARWTLTLLTAKPGLHTGHGRDHAGEVWCDALGIDLEAALDPPATSVLSGIACAGDAAARRRHAQHKGSFGQVVVVGGAPGMSGAAWLAARAALMAGAGRVHASLLDDAATASPWPELMQRRAAWSTDRALLDDATWVCGCGGGDEVAAALPAVLSCRGALVLDADALNAVARDRALATLLAARGTRGRITVLTPHPLEAARLLGSDVARVQGDRLAAAQHLAEQFGAVVVLKGSGSIVAAPGRCPRINGTGNAALATAGTGDVLAGWTGGLLAARGARSMDEARQQVAAAVALHGLAADRAAQPVLPAGRLIDAMAETVAAMPQATTGAG